MKASPSSPRLPLFSTRGLLALALIGYLTGCASMSEVERTQFNPASDKFAMFVVAVPGNIRQGPVAGTFDTDASGTHQPNRVYRIRWMAPDGRLHLLDSATLPSESPAITVRLKLDEPGIVPGTWKLLIDGPSSFHLTKTFEILPPPK